MKAKVRTNASMRPPHTFYNLRVIGGLRDRAWKILSLTLPIIAWLLGNMNLKGCDTCYTGNEVWQGTIGFTITGFGPTFSVNNQANYTTTDAYEDVSGTEQVNMSEDGIACNNDSIVYTVSGPDDNAVFSVTVNTNACTYNLWLNCGSILGNITVTGPGVSQTTQAYMAANEFDAYIGPATFPVGGWIGGAAATPNDQNPLQFALPPYGQPLTGSTNYDYDFGPDICGFEMIVNVSVSWDLSLVGPPNTNTITLPPSRVPIPQYQTGLPDDGYGGSANGNCPELPGSYLKWACGLCTFTMAINAALGNNSLQVENFNGQLVDGGGFDDPDSGCSPRAVLPDVAVKIGSGGKAVFMPVGTTASRCDLERILKMGYPVMVGVQNDQAPTASNGAFVPNHFVLVTGETDGFFNMIDPLTGQTSLDYYAHLSQGYNYYYVYGYVVPVAAPAPNVPNIPDPSGGSSGLEITADGQTNPPDLLLIDPNGQRTGYSPLAGVVREMPQSAYSTLALADSSGFVGAIQDVVDIFQPLQTTYQLYILGNYSGAYPIVFDSVAGDASLQGALDILTATSPKSLTPFQATLGPAGWTLSADLSGSNVVALCSFNGGSNGAAPFANLVQGRDGNFYGTTEAGGANGDGTVFRMNTNGALTTLYTFGSVTNNGVALDGANPYGSLVQTSDGNLYGTTESGGANVAGTVFRITTNGVFSSLYSFGSVNDGSGDLLDGFFPYSGLVVGPDGNLYGTTKSGGLNHDPNGNSCGTVFQITTNGVLTTIYSFGSVTDDNGNPVDGDNPYGAMILGPDGNLYGTTESGGTNQDENDDGYGTVFQITTDGTLTTLYCFGSVTNDYGTALDGANPYAGLVHAQDGKFYGTTFAGGTGNYGTVFQVTSNGQFAVLHSFAGTAEGADPRGGLVQGKDGNLYGTTVNGGLPGGGTIFQLGIGGALTNIYSFVGACDGGLPQSGLLLASDGNIYGTDSAGGTNGAGVIFRLTTAVAPLIVPAIQSVNLTNNALSIAWTALSGLSYQVQYSTNLTGSNWLNLGSSILATNDIMTATEVIGPDPQRFYRIMLLP